MRTLIKLVIIVFLTIFSYSQDLYNPPKLIETSNNTLFDKNFNQNQFIRGWNWGSTGRKLDEALKINYYHNMDLDSINYLNGARVVKQTDIWHKYLPKTELIS